MNPFDHVNAITFNKNDLPTDEYNAYIVNLALSIYPDCVMQANEMNMRHDLPGSAQYAYLINSVRQRKRYAPWPKKHKNESLEVVKKYYSFGDEKAKAALSILSPEDIEELKTRMLPGGAENESD